MVDVLVCGGGPCGLATAMLLARDGYEVTVLEKDPDGAPASAGEAWEAWERKGVAQFHQPHYLHALFRQVAERELPGVVNALDDAGACRFNPIAAMPPFVTERDPRPDDDRFEAVTARRPTMERALAVAAEAEPGVGVRRGVRAAALLTGPSAIDSVPHVVGVRTTSGEEIRADLVVDALGRRSRLPEWIEEVGGRSPYEEASDCGFSYYTRYFRSRDGGVPDVVAGLLSPVGTISLLTLPADDGTWSVTVYAETGDRPLKALRHAETWTKVVAACPLQAHWLDGEAITDVLPMSGIPDRYRRFVVDGSPVATGVVAVGDAWACTNPSLGRGISLALKHAALLRDVVRMDADDPAELALAWDAVTEDELAPWYRTQVAMDRARHTEIAALRDGDDPPPPADEAGAVRAAMTTAMLYDADVFRAFLEMMSCLTLPDQVFTRPGMVERVLRVAGEAEPFDMPGPSREELLALVAPTG